MEFYNEWKIMTEANKGDIQIAIHLSCCELQQGYLLIPIPRYPQSFSDYLWHHRYASSKRSQSLISTQSFTHIQGYACRDLKSYNLMLSLKPLKTTVINFNRAYTLTQCAQGTCRVTGRKILEMEVSSGICWLGDIILESGLGLNEQFKVHSEKGSVFKAGQYPRGKNQSKKLLWKWLFSTPKVVKRMVDLVRTPLTRNRLHLFDVGFALYQFES